MFRFSTVLFLMFTANAWSASSKPTVCESSPFASSTMRSIFKRNEAHLVCEAKLSEGAVNWVKYVGVGIHQTGNGKTFYSVGLYKQDGQGFIFRYTDNMKISSDQCHFFSIFSSGFTYLSVALGPYGGSVYYQDRASKNKLKASRCVYRDSMDWL